MRKVLIVTPDLEVREADLDAGGSPLSVLQDAVGGWVQLVPLSETEEFYVNEEGKILNPPLPVNLAASRLYAETYPGAPDGFAVVNGPAVFTGGVDDETGETLPLGDDFKARVLRAVEAARLIVSVLGN